MSQKKTIMESFEKENTVKEAKVKETKDGFKVKGKGEGLAAGHADDGNDVIPAGQKAHRL